MKGKRISESIINSIIELYKQGESQNSISKRLNLKLATVHNILKRYGLIKNNENTSVNEDIRQIIEEHRQKIEEQEKAIVLLKNELEQKILSFENSIDEKINSQTEQLIKQINENINALLTKITQEQAQEQAQQAQEQAQEQAVNTETEEIRSPIITEKEAIGSPTQQQPVLQPAQQPLPAQVINWTEIIQQILATIIQAILQRPPQIDPFEQIIQYVDKFRKLQQVLSPTPQEATHQFLRDVQAFFNIIKQAGGSPKTLVETTISPVEKTIKEEPTESSSVEIE